MNTTLENRRCTRPFALARCARRALAALALTTLLAADCRAETETARDARLAWWTHDRFGMFIHFGLYSLPARHEWVKSIERMSEEAYDRYFAEFEPDRLDPRDWARQAKAAGMKYIVLTTKHHEGFCLFDSKLTDYKSTNTKCGRDIVREFVDACRAEGLKVGFYYSLPDWHHPQFPVDRYHPRRPVKCGPWDKEGREGPEAPWEALNKDRDIVQYRKYLYGQVTELLTNYGTIDLMWFDFTMTGPRTKTPDDWKSGELLTLVRKLQPNIIVNDRLGENGKCIYGDFATAEQERPTKWMEANGRRVPWEACQTFSGSWGYHRDETSWKSTRQIIDLLVASVGNGGNLILNVGPNGRGEFDSRAKSRLREIGEWMALHDRAVYGCTQPPPEFKAPAHTALTWNPSTGRLYLFLFAYPPTGTLRLEFASRVRYAQMLNDSSEVKLVDRDLLQLPPLPPAVAVPIVELRLQR